MTTKCPECGFEISEEKATCPNCGFKIPGKEKSNIEVIACRGKETNSIPSLTLLIIFSFIAASLAIFLTVHGFINKETLYQTIMPILAVIFLFCGSFLTWYLSFLKKNNKKTEDCITFDKKKKTFHIYLLDKKEIDVFPEDLLIKQKPFSGKGTMFIVFIKNQMNKEYKKMNLGICDNTQFAIKRINEIKEEI